MANPKFYFSWVTFSTIGLGDMTMEGSSDRYVWVCMLYTFAGLSLSVAVAS